MTGIDPDNLARGERAALADTLVEVGPDRPTLCDGWTTRDLAAHLVLRDRRPDAAVGILVKPLAGYTAKVQAELAGRPFEELVALVRQVPAHSPARLRAVDQMINTQEYFIHHEDIRRAQPGWQPRPLARRLGEALWSRSQPLARLGLRRFPAALLLDAPGYGELSTGGGGPALRVTGDPGELALFLAGRQRAARVELTGPADLAERLRTRRMGV
ncbi:MAG TPA: TIGR03085 family metal-binding protein [Rugosimonospora sp.]|nr:TIGR03085 family metal-binding protein [Rugosimonospora sp.]